MLTHQYVGFRTLIIFIIRLLTSLLRFCDWIWMLYTYYFVVYQTNTMINILMLIMSIRHVISLHIENEYIMPQKTTLPIQYIIHLRLLFHFWEGDLLVSQWRKAEIFDNFTSRAVAVPAICVQNFGWVI